MVEQWNFEYSVSKADDGLILFSDPCHSDKNRYHSADPNIPSLQYSIIPRHMNTAQPFFSVLAREDLAFSVRINGYGLWEFFCRLLSNPIRSSVDRSTVFDIKSGYHFFDHLTLNIDNLS
jgi:hypothetical protein